MDLPLQIRSVYAANLEDEFININNTIADHPFIAVDTVFPGIPYRLYTKPEHLLTPDQLYETLKTNVNSVPIIQLGFTLSDEAGNLPVINGNRIVWEFNLRDFDPNVHAHDRNFLQNLRQTHPNLDAYHELGIPSRRLGDQLLQSNIFRHHSVKWLTFHGAWDMGYLHKIISGVQLPPTLESFKNMVRVIHFGDRVFDLKHVANEFNFHGVLEKIAQDLGVVRTVGQRNQAGSDSLLTSGIFHEIRTRGMDINDGRFSNVFFGLDR